MKTCCVYGLVRSQRVENIFLPVAAKKYQGPVRLGPSVLLGVDSYLRHHFLLTLLRNLPAAVPHGKIFHVVVKRMRAA